MQYSLDQVNKDIIGLEEAILALSEIVYLRNGPAVKLLTEKLSALKSEKSKLEQDLI